MQQKEFPGGGLTLDERRRIEVLQKRIKELEHLVEQLRVSRRVLMNLLERVEREKCSEVARLQEENRKLQRANQRYARTLWKRNRLLIESNQVEK
ncbi:MAG: translation initiation factor 2 [Firmicutes bacterium]|nr:translation initiation factor 2 [Bacillota bacterium]